MVRTCYHVLRLDWCGGTICRVRKVSLRRQLGPRTTQNFQESAPLTPLFQRCWRSAAMPDVSYSDVSVDLG